MPPRSVEPTGELGECLPERGDDVENPIQAAATEGLSISRVEIAQFEAAIGPLEFLIELDQLALEGGTVQDRDPFEVEHNPAPPFAVHQLVQLFADSYHGTLIANGLAEIEEPHDGNTSDVVYLDVGRGPIRTGWVPVDLAIWTPGTSIRGFEFMDASQVSGRALPAERPPASRRGRRPGRPASFFRPSRGTLSRLPS